MSSKLNKYFIVIMAFLLLLSIIGIITLAVKLSSHRPYEISIASTTPAEYNWNIYIDGAVANPGLYPAKENDTIYSLLKSAGIKENADLSPIKIYVPKMGESNLPQKISINRADIWLLEVLPSIGHNKAKAIVDYRKQNGPFRRIEDLLKVSGIGKPILEDIKELITIE